MSITGVVGLEMLCNTSRGIYNSTAMFKDCDIFLGDDDNSGYTGSVDMVLFGWDLGFTLVRLRWKEKRRENDKSGG